MSKVDEAWDALPPADEILGVIHERSAEVAALRALFGVSAFRLLGNAGIETGEAELSAVEAIQKEIAEAYLYALGRRAVTRVDPMQIDAWRALTDEQRLELVSTCCRGCGRPDPRCQCWNDD